MHRIKFMVFVGLMAQLIPYQILAQDCSRAVFFQNIKSGDIDGVTTCLKEGRKSTDEDNEGKDGLQIAIRNGQAEIVEYFLKQDIRDYQVENAFLDALEMGDKVIIQMLINSGLDLNAIESYNGGDPFQVACEKGEVSLMKLLIDQGYDYSENPQNRGFSPIEILAVRGHLDALKYWISLGQIIENDPFKSSVIAQVKGLGYNSVAVVLIDQLLDDWEEQNKPLTPQFFYQFIQHGLTEQLGPFLTGSYDINQPHTGIGPLFFAAYHNQPDVVITLIEKGFDVNETFEGFTPLILAVQEEKAEAVAALIENGADVNATGRGGNTALMVAVEREDEEIIRLLLAAGADTDIKNDEGERLADMISHKDRSLKVLVKSGFGEPKVKGSKDFDQEMSDAKRAMREGDIFKAISHYRNAIDLNSKDLMPWYQKGEAFQELARLRCDQPAYVDSAMTNYLKATNIIIQDPKWENRRNAQKIVQSIEEVRRFWNCADIRAFDRWLRSPIETSILLDQAYYRTLNETKRLRESKDLLGASKAALKTYELSSQYHGRHHQDTYSAVQELANVWAEKGNYQEAIKYKRLELELLNNVLGDNHPLVHTANHDLAANYQIAGDYGQAELLIDQNLARARRLFPRNHFHVLNSQNSKILQLYLQGNHPDARALAESAYQDNLNALGPLHMLTINAVNFIGILSSHKADYETARDYLEKAVKSIGYAYRDQPMAINVLTNYGANEIQSGNPEGGLQYLKAAASIAPKILGANHPGGVANTVSLSYAYYLQNKVDSASLFADQAMTVALAQLGESHPIRAYATLNHAFILDQSGSKDEAEQLYIQGTEMLINVIRDYLPYINENDRRNFVGTLRPAINTFNAFAIKRYETNPRISKTLFEQQLYLKGMLLASVTNMINLIRNSGDSELEGLFTQWLTIKEQSLQSQSSVNLASKADSLERVLSQRSTAFGNERRQVSLDKVRSVLKDDEALVEIIRIDQSPEIIYAALVIRKDQDLPVLVKTESGSDLEGRILKYYRNSVKLKLRDTLSYQNYWSFIDAELKGVKKVHISPDGVYNLINPATLYDPDTDQYLVDKYPVKVLTNSRSLLQTPTERSDIIRLFGRPDFGSHRKKDGNERSVLASYIDRGLFQIEQLDDLPGTEAEIIAIGELLINNKLSVASFSQSEATEGAVKESASPRMLHIATHGFFIESESDDGQEVIPAPQNSRLYGEALVRSGLILSRDQENDGILTAAEVSQLDLNGTELAVLSACETALGEVLNGEGVYGLKRSFIQSGVDNLIISLWKVDDQATSEFMTLFYKSWIEIHDIPGAFHSAQATIRSKYTDPYYWGAFVLNR